ncbi:MAG: type II toxin-antitoxin system VapC family toxin [Synergistaceae bacterium]|nr:type II toxin-antitoxin system VapC family toxin [Synergistaceae bacterium]MBQ3347077.1 type II toxin-antitoxin system VapC family toxin [Synergistaceae bacterium]MBQ3399445.1 type II toxin-antitoxin system VapC family toxin [Synergistaceae bacterium]MBQ3759089.1 type II toxin-antitoxin system VapC family toxin [Synergistaceae bacterium]MBQ4401965.1 type II toxin-antitoxin system VapC family toxin [Synergistaceae bacterium]
MYLLDTCTFIWSVQNASKLSQKAKEILAGNDPVYVSKATFWEIAVKKTTGKLNIRQNTFELEEICLEEDIYILPLKLRYFERIQKMPLIHRDPFDRIIIASAIEEGYTLLTSDEIIPQYDDVKTLW